MTSSRVITLPRRKASPKPSPPRYETVTAEERSAADALLRKAQALHRMMNTRFVTAVVMAQAPGLIKEARAALDELQEML